MKKFTTLLLIIFFSFTSAAMAANKPVRIARLPIIIQNNKLDYETSATLEVKMARAINIPLNKTLKFAEYLPPKYSSKVLNEIWQEMRTRNRRAKFSDAIKILANNIDADLVVCPVLRQYYQRIAPSSVTFESHLSSAVSTEIIIYDKRTDEFIDKRFSRRYNDSYNRYGTASYLAGECFDKVIQDSGLRQIISSIRTSNK